MTSDALPTLNTLPKQKVYYITLSVYKFIDVFTRRDYIELFLESLRLYQEEYGLILYDWIIMSNQINLIANSKDGNLKPLVMDFKKFTAIQLLDAIERDATEIRKNWILEILKPNNSEPRFWGGNYNAQAIYYKSFYLVKQREMYRKPFRAGIVKNETHYNYSSCSTKWENTEGILMLNEVCLQDEVPLNTDSLQQ